jgi:hypothetical protein
VFISTEENVAKYEMELELTGFKLRIKGERDDIPRLVDHAREQIAALVAPAANIISGQLPAHRETLNVTSDGSTKKRHRRSNGVPKKEQPRVVFIHSPEKWGTPLQSWTPCNKILWMLYTLAQSSGTEEHSGPAIADLFNQHFKQAGLLKKNNVSRDLGTLKQKSIALVGENANNSPAIWFLTVEGVKEALKLVAEAGGAAAA